MGDNNYSEDKRYILETIKKTSEYVEALDKNFTGFKIEVSNKIAIIQTKLMIYVAGGSVVMSVAVNYIAKAIGAK